MKNADPNVGTRRCKCRLQSVRHLRTRPPRPQDRIRKCATFPPRAAKIQVVQCKTCHKLWAYPTWSFGTKLGGVGAA